MPDCPAALCEAARAVWERLGPKFEAMGIMAEVDEAAFAILCEAYASWLALIELARGDGPIVKVNGQPVPNPYAVRADKEAEKIRRMLAEFGGTPSARSRLTIERATPAAADELRSFLDA
jgi:P27 family predicted phage terminase small subunit